MYKLYIDNYTLTHKKNGNDTFNAMHLYCTIINRFTVVTRLIHVINLTACRQISLYIHMLDIHM